ncbi:hypothetical protein WOLCODRAFT_153706 [Wolfiporia cocos MD-104 SS10]|uniref:Uncharacterized protein n=1 Tax=Wolfiporia cocos (strain MD-104) TaxID=742152 RepID=A0A2H3JQ75_WOLCO|nr:hypothetical protein WOLCODRAFT_153706 [Wolfiporia cocos MD-104 SS10]
MPLHCASSERGVIVGSPPRIVIVPRVHRLDMPLCCLIQQPRQGARAYLDLCICLRGCNLDGALVGAGQGRRLLCCCLRPTEPGAPADQRGGQSLTWVSAQGTGKWQWSGAAPSKGRGLRPAQGAAALRRQLPAHDALGPLAALASCSGRAQIAHWPRWPRRRLTINGGGSSPDRSLSFPAGAETSWCLGRAIVDAESIALSFARQQQCAGARTGVLHSVCIAIARAGALVASERVLPDRIRACRYEEAVSRLARAGRTPPAPPPASIATTPTVPHWAHTRRMTRDRVVRARSHTIEECRRNKLHTTAQRSARRGLGGARVHGRVIALRRNIIVPRMMRLPSREVPPQG